MRPITGQKITFSRVSENKKYNRDLLVAAKKRGSSFVWLSLNKNFFFKPHVLTVSNIDISCVFEMKMNTS